MDAVQGVFILPRVATHTSAFFVELKPGLNEPDGVCCGTGYDTGAGCRTEVDPCRFLAIVKVVCYYAFAVAVGCEIYCSRGRYC